MPDSGRYPDRSVQGGMYLKKKILAVCDAEAEYTRRFCEYVGKKKDYPFEAAAFGSVEKLRQF